MPLNTTNKAAYQQSRIKG